jgi:DMATS type aromatic prenyltransferase
MTQFDTVTTDLRSIEQTDLLSNLPAIDRSSQVGFDPEKLIPQPTYVEAGIEKLTALSRALGMADQTAEMVAIFRGMTTSWGDQKVGDTSGWQSDVSDDLSPFEFSIVFKENRAELRVLLEAQGKEPTLESNWQAGLELNQYLAENFNINLDRFEQIKDLYVPTDAKSKLAMWHAVCFYPDKAPEFKLYLNPQAQGASKAPAVVEESLVRLGFAHAWMGLAEVAAQRGPDKDQCVYFSLDLSSDTQARVKVYLRHYDATAEDLEKALSLAQNYVPGDATEFCEAMVEGQNVFSAKPVITCFAWVEGDNFTPAHGTLYLPISNYANDDRVVKDRLNHYLTDQNLCVSIYNSTLQAFSQRPLELGSGLHSYLAVRREKQTPRVTIYLNPEVNTVQPPIETIKLQNSFQSLSSLEEILSNYEELGLSDHPFFQRLDREEVNPHYLWLLITNISETATNFTRRLANVLARIDDDRIRCILAKQLNDELGNGDVDRIHRKLFDRLINAIEPWRINSGSENMLMPGKEISSCFEEIYIHSDPYIGVGSLVMAEIYAEQFDVCLGKQLRKTNIDPDDITWVTTHEELECEHAGDSFVLARLVGNSAENTAKVLEGVEKTRMASWKFLDGLYRLCYGDVRSMVDRT